MTSQIYKRYVELVMDEGVREAVDDLLAIEKHSYAALLQRLAQRVKGLTAERDDAWRICATWRERAHAAEAENKWRKRVSEDVDLKAENARLVKELAAADRFGEEMYRRVQFLESTLSRTDTCASCGATIVKRESYP